jgi:hypothetical protein
VKAADFFKNFKIEDEEDEPKKAKKAKEEDTEEDSDDDEEDDCQAGRGFRLYSHAPCY